MLNGLGLVAKDNRVLVSSVDVAENFERKHKNVVRAIENIAKCDKSFTGLNFELSEYEDPSGRILQSYLMTRDGFTLLVMGFTGYKAMEWKIKYIKAFNAMEAKLTERVALPIYAEMFGANCEYNDFPPARRIRQAALALVNMPELRNDENYTRIDAKSPFGRDLLRMVSCANWLADCGAKVSYSALVEMAGASGRNLSFFAVIKKYGGQITNENGIPGCHSMLYVPQVTNEPQDYATLMERYRVEKKRAATAIGNLKASRSREQKMRNQLNKALDVIAKLTK